ncbi:hypothetical protein H9L39_01972 [Fusarium oxysporum f. sp. albedinis]|nr:hypothetical protein H9L39_01972 [Fusarium oxysporum f. sp. albedinis]
MDTSSLTWSDKYFPDGESYTSVSHDKGFHAACVEIVGDNLSAKGFLESCTWNILDRGFHDSFTQPPPSFVALRTGRLKSSLALELMHAISNRLPIEICERVATYCLSDKTPPGCLATSGFWWPRERSHTAGFRWPKRLGPNMEVEGLRYVRSLSTRRLTQQDALVFETRYRKRGARNRPEACLIIYYSEDHGGIREVIITEDNELPSLNMEPGLSWSISRHQDTLLQFVLRYDDIKLRFLTVAQTLEHDMRYEQRSRGVLPERFDSLPQNGDGRRRCVGQVRLDCLDLPLPVYSNNF